MKVCPRDIWASYLASALTSKAERQKDHLLEDGVTADHFDGSVIELGPDGVEL